jgi:hypothetical protein
MPILWGQQDRVVQQGPAALLAPLALAVLSVLSLGSSK